MHNTKRILVAAALLASAMTFGQEAKQIGALVRFGNFRPSELQAKNEGKQWPVFGVQFNLGKQRMGANGSSSGLAISIDGYSKGSLTGIPVMVNQVSANKGIILSAGLGVSFNREAKPTISGLEKKSRMQVAYGFGAGYDLAKYKVPGVLEIRYFGNGYSTLQGFSIGVGLRF